MEIKVKGEVVNESDDFRFVGDGFDLILRFLSACVEVGGENWGLDAGHCRGVALQFRS